MGPAHAAAALTGAAVSADAGPGNDETQTLVEGKAPVSLFTILLIVLVVVVVVALFARRGRSV